MSRMSSLAEHPFTKAWNCLRRPIWLYNPITGRQVYANQAALVLWAAESLTEFLARDFKARSPAVKARLRRLMDRTADGSSLSERWTVFPHGCPVTVQATISAFHSAEGDLLLLIEAEPKELHADERRSVEVLRHASALMGLFDGRGTAMFANPATYRVYGSDTVDFLCRFAVRSEGEAMLAAALSGPAAGLRNVVTPAGARWHHMDARPVLDPVTGRLCVLLNEQDVTLQIEADIARTVAEQKAQIADAKQRFLTEMSHELRTPLNAVIGFSGLLADAGLEGEASDRAARVYAEGLRLRDVVNQMLDGPPADGEAAETPEPQASSPPGSRMVELYNAVASPAVSGLRALYVDDNDNNRALVRAMLATTGIECETANDGQAGVEAAALGDWDVILMDIQMPVMGGVAACRRIRAMTGMAAATPIIALTANTQAEQLSAYAEAGMDDCIAKPIDMIELLTKTAHWGASGWRQAVMDVGVSARH